MLFAGSPLRPAHYESPFRKVDLSPAPTTPAEPSIGCMCRSAAAYLSRLPALARAQLDRTSPLALVMVVLCLLAILILVSLILLDAYHCWARYRTRTDEPYRPRRDRRGGGDDGGVGRGDGELFEAEAEADEKGRRHAVGVPVAGEEATESAYRHGPELESCCATVSPPPSYDEAAILVPTTVACSLVPAKC